MSGNEKLALAKAQALEPLNNTRENCFEEEEMVNLDVKLKIAKEKAIIKLEEDKKTSASILEKRLNSLLEIRKRYEDMILKTESEKRKSLFQKWLDEVNGDISATNKKILDIEPKSNYVFR